MPPAKPSTRGKTAAAAALLGGKTVKPVPTKTKSKTSKKAVNTANAEEETAKDESDKTIIPVVLNDSTNIAETPQEEVTKEDEELSNMIKEAIKTDAATTAKPKSKPKPKPKKKTVDAAADGKAAEGAEAADDDSDDEFHVDEPTTVNDVLKGYRAFQARIYKTAKKALHTVADIEEAKGTGMSRDEQEQFRKGYASSLESVAGLMKDFNEYKSKASDIAARDRADDRTAWLPNMKTLDSEPPPRLLFEEPTFSRAQTLKVCEADTADYATGQFTKAMLRMLLDNALALAGADRKEADAMIDAFTDPSIATTNHDDAISALTSLKTVVGIPVFVPGSRLEQTHRAIGEELFGLISELQFAQDKLESVLAAAGEIIKVEPKPLTDKEKEKAEKKKNNVSVRAPRKQSAPKVKAQEGEGGVVKKEKKERKPREPRKPKAPPPVDDRPPPTRNNPEQQF